jgi:hypothetical protein
VWESTDDECRRARWPTDRVAASVAVRQAHLSELHKVASSLVDLFESVRISWVPREMKAEADRLVRGALGALD